MLVTITALMVLLQVMVVCTGTMGAVGSSDEGTGGWLVAHSKQDAFAAV